MVNVTAQRRHLKVCSIVVGAVLLTLSLGWPGWAAAAPSTAPSTAPTKTLAAVSVPAKISDLSWMKGAWAGPVGTQTLEERWNEAKSGSLAALVRITGSAGTSMVELIVIEEEAGSLVLRLQQFDPGFVARTAKPQQFALSDIGKQTVTFTATGDNALRKLTYSRPSEHRFQIDITPATGKPFAVKMQAVE